MLRHFNCSGISDEPLSPEPIRNQENISPFACAILFGKSAIVPPTPPCIDRVMPVRVGFSWKSPMLDMAHISVAVRQSVGPVRLAPLSWFYFSWLLAASRISCVIPARYLVRQLCLAKKNRRILWRENPVGNRRVSASTRSNICALVFKVWWTFLTIEWYELQFHRDSSAQPVLSSKGIYYLLYMKSSCETSSLPGFFVIDVVLF